MYKWIDRLRDRLMWWFNFLIYVFVFLRNYDIIKLFYKDDFKNFEK